MSQTKQKQSFYKVKKKRADKASQRIWVPLQMEVYRKKCGVV